MPKIPARLTTCRLAPGRPVRPLALTALGAILAAAACLTAPGSARAATGSDLGSGYTWRDSNSGAVAETAFFDGPTTTIAPANDAIPAVSNLPWPFTFYGTPYTSFYVSDNGWINFIDPRPNSYPVPAPLLVPDANPPNAYIASFWNQLRSSNLAGGQRIQHGPVNALGAYMFDVVALDLTTNQTVGWKLLLFRTGDIEISYTQITGAFGGSTVGIENQAGTDGAWISAGGVQAPGVPATFDLGYTIEFQPPPVLPPQCAGIPTIGCGAVTNGNMPGTLAPPISVYGCSANTYAAAEVVYKFTLAQSSVVTLDLIPGSGTNLAMFLLDACNERNCIRGPVTNTSLALRPGTYYVAVDAPTAGDEGSFSINLGCQPFGAPIACGSTVAGDNIGNPNVFPSYPCAGLRDLSGGEQFYDLNVPTATNVRVTLSGLSANLDVLVLNPDTGEIAADDCVGWGDDVTVAWDAQPGQYVIVVDGVAGASGTFTLEVECSIDLTCGNLAGTFLFDRTTLPLQTLSGDTTLGTDVVERYACDTAILHDGPELVYEVILAGPGQIVFVQTSGPPGLSFYLLTDCNEGSCISGGEGDGCGALLPAGTYYLVVDGQNGASGPFELLMAFERTLGHWTDCELPSGATQVTDTESTFWQFNDGAYCYTEPGSHNYPNGCVFAMYAVVQCGTEMHIPFWDVESGHMRIYDVLAGDYVNLTAVSTGGWSMTGTDIFWEDPDCVNGTDGRWNDQTTDISMTDPNGLCGVFRLEFINHSGFEWELYANCTGVRAGEFSIHDSLCGAMQNYAPLPSLSIVSVTEVASCPDVTITYEIRNDGCALARNVAVQLWDDTTLVDTDLIPEVPYGTSLVRSFSTTYSGTTTANVFLSVDFADDVLECTESGGVACDPANGLETWGLLGCTGACSVQASLTATPASLCIGATTTLDAGGSSSSLCASGVLEYQLSGPTGILVSWRTNPLFPGIAPTATSRYNVEVRCQGEPTCFDVQEVDVFVERPPAFDPASVTATDLSTCSLGTRVAWSDATFFGTTATGVYNVYRSDVSCAEAVDIVTNPANLIAQNLTVTFFVDLNTVEGTTYFYVVEAEDDTAAVACQPRGPVRGGASTRVDASGGTCSGVLERATADINALPVVGSSLRLGGTNGGVPRYGQDFVDLEWTTNFPINVFGNEHFHIARSEQPDTGFRLLPEPPLLFAPGYTDFTAGDTVGNVGLHVWYYLVGVSDGCENDNLSIDNP